MLRPTIYYVIYPQGSCGSFISLILAQMMWPKLARIEEFKDSGTADHIILKYVNNLQIVNFMTISATNELSNPYFIKNTELLPVVERIKYLPHKEKFIFTDHKFPSWRDTLLKYPNTKFLIIGYDSKMSTRLWANKYIKTINRNHRQFEHNIHIERTKWLNSPARQGKLKDLDIYNFPDWAVQEYAKINGELDNTNNLNNPVPTDLENYIYRIDMYQIIHDQINLLEDLSKWCGYPIAPECLPTYENYLTAQKELLPWLDDRLT